MQQINLNILTNEKYRSDLYAFYEIFKNEDRFITFIDTMEFEKIKKAQELILIFKSFKRRFQEIRLNFDDLFDALVDIEFKTFSSGMSQFDFELHFVNINRLFVNFLSSFKFFIESIEMLLKTDETKSRKFKEVTRFFYENFFSYRFFINLRNYTQHRDYAIQYLTGNRDYRNNKVYAEICFCKSKLLEDEKIKKKLSKDLCHYSETFPLKDHLTNILSIIEKFDYELHRIYAHELNYSIPILLDLKKLKTKDSSQIAYGFFTKEAQNFKITHVIFELSLADEIFTKMKIFKL